MRSKFPKVKGAESAMAQGQAIMRTAVKTFTAFEASAKSQNVVETKAILSTAIVNFLLILLVKVVKPSSLFLLNTSLLHSCVR